MTLAELVWILLTFMTGLSLGAGAEWALIWFLAKQMSPNAVVVPVGYLLIATFLSLAILVKTGLDLKDDLVTIDYAPLAGFASGVLGALILREGGARFSGPPSPW